MFEQMRALINNINYSRGTVSVTRNLNIYAFLENPKLIQTLMKYYVYTFFVYLVLFFPR